MSEIDQNLLQQVPFGMLTLDTDGGVVWVNEAMCNMLAVQDSELLGKSIAQLPEHVRNLLEPGPKLYRMPTDHRWVCRELIGNDGSQRLFIVADVSLQEQLAEENARLMQQVEDLKLTDELTGLANKRAITQALDLHISRSRRYQNPLSTVLVHVDLSAFNGVQPLSTDPIILAVSQFLRDRLRWVDQISRWEDNTFLLVLPETTEEDARGLVDKIRDEQGSIQLPEAYTELMPQLAFGVACWKKGDDQRTLLRSTLQNMQESSGA
ncbi:sensor domain-containing diguanylate cyclase [Thiosocius teredinicola]|uniref:sensor domain-containing diguanylate cyclase n=1 Tax=Thiosocius teredinicola TaxID=1973002 RepID=UPI0013DDD6A7